MSENNTVKSKEEVMLEAAKTLSAAEKNQKSFWSRWLGRSILEAIVGIKFFEKKSNAASVIAIFLVVSVCYSVVFKEQWEFMPQLFNMVFVVIGYYFGSKQDKVDAKEE